ncbi:hypothetical protein NDU88_005341 [Pleurodeles waltl]|uniref:Uncharacterized protein n=1 Tax=Pleurodeles waltl TaxID=8319 RepID=A0AAV7TTZ4_PLEWA|nr:hypothetical protein NDU88_005341 [Pleurodeles waltl]
MATHCSHVSPAGVQAESGSEDIQYQAGGGFPGEGGVLPGEMKHLHSVLLEQQEALDKAQKQFVQADLNGSKHPVGLSAEMRNDSACTRTLISFLTVMQKH